jgi:GntR family transcriptional regulator/MocR family aminotransferase
MPGGLRIRLKRTASSSLTEQISQTIRAAILDGRIEPGARLPSWRDLAAQLGVARGTVRAAYERLADELLVATSGPAGTHVTEQPPRATTTAAIESVAPVPSKLPGPGAAPLPFEMGVPAQDGFPIKLWTRLVARAARADAAAPTRNPDPCGVLELRVQIAGYLALARGIRCTPAQIIITRGYRDGLNLAIRTLRVEGGAAWMEDPGYFVARAALTLAGMRPVPVAVDEHGLDVQQGLAMAPDAALAVVTAGQQAPLGVTMSIGRRRALLRWAMQSGGWIVEDDYLSELQLKGRAAPALLAMDPAARVIYVGTFSKTISPALGVGFIVAPPALAARFAEVAACLAPAPNAMIQLAVAEFVREGHYLRHLRRMKRLYAERRDALRTCLGDLAGVEAMAGLALVLRLPPGSDDVTIARAALARGLAPAPLSKWYASDSGRTPGLLLGVTNLSETELQPACDQLRALVDPLY